MKIKKQFGVGIAILMTVFSFAVAQQQTKVVDFGNNAEITQVNVSDKYIAIDVYDKSAPGVASVFDKSGNKLLEKKGDGGVPITHVELSDTLNYFITIEASLDDAEGYLAHKVEIFMRITLQPVARCGVSQHMRGDSRFLLMVCT